MINPCRNEDKASIITITRGGGRRGVNVCVRENHPSVSIAYGILFQRYSTGCEVPSFKSWAQHARPEAIS